GRPAAAVRAAPYRKARRIAHRAARGTEAAARARPYSHRAGQGFVRGAHLASGRGPAGAPVSFAAAHALRPARGARLAGRRIRARGLMRTEQGKRPVVAPVPHVVARPLVRLFHPQPRTLDDLLEVRALLEGEAAGLAALRGTEADFDMIRRRYEPMVAAREHD